MLGARRWQTTLRINLPLVAPAITGGALLAAIDSLALFGPQAIIGTPAQIVFLPTRIYATIGSYPPRWGEASALSLVLVALTVAGLAMQRGYLDRRSYITVGGRGVRTKHVALGAWRWPLLAFCLMVVFFSAVAPIGVLALTAFSQKLDRAAFGRQFHAGTLRCGAVPRPGLRTRHPQQLQAGNRCGRNRRR